METIDLTLAPPRRWSDTLGGIRWLPRIIDKARAALGGRLGGYLYGQSPGDRNLLSILGTDYPGFTRIVKAAPDDAAVLAALEREFPKGVARARRWSSRPLPLLFRPMTLMLDFDDGYIDGPLAGLRKPISALYGTAALLLRRILKDEAKDAL
ncbi:MAG TPA: DUF5069 domain-containing protein [Candidatus Dormibacteraeota bacterium]|nr:DUF5069 domain-containing protein [Candidatus Dormibacteraeota bacterium]